MKKRILAALLSLFLVVGLLPVTATAEEGDAESEEQNTELFDTPLETSDVNGESGTNTVSGTGTSEDPFVIASKEQFIQFSKIINSGMPDDEETLPTGITADDYAVFNISSDYKTGWTALNLGYYKMACDIVVTTDDQFLGIGNDAIGFAGYLDFDGHSFTFDDCVYNLSDYADDEGTVPGIYFGIIRVFGADTNKSVIGLDHIVIKGSVTFNISSDISLNNPFNGNSIGIAYGHFAGKTTRKTGTIFSEANITVNAALKQATNLNIGGISAWHRGIRNVESHGSMMSSGDITVHVVTSDDVQPSIFIGGIYGRTDCTNRFMYGYYDGTITVDNLVPTKANPDDFQSDNSYKWIGGIASRPYQWNYITSSCFAGDINLNQTVACSEGKKATSYIGGISGYAFMGNDHCERACLNVGRINVTNESNNHDIYVGGISGGCDGYTGAMLTQLHAFAEITTAGNNIYAGGLIGKEGPITNPSNSEWVYAPDAVERAVYTASTSQEVLDQLTRIQLTGIPYGYKKSVTLPIIAYQQNNEGDNWYEKLETGNYTSSNQSVIRADNSNQGIIEGVGEAELSTFITMSFGEGHTKIPLKLHYTIEPKAMPADDTKVYGLQDKYDSASAAAAALQGISVADGDALLEKGVDFTVSQDADNNKFIVTFKGNYTGTIEKSYMISDHAPSVTASGYTGAYDAESHGITVETTASEVEILYCETEDGTYTSTLPMKKDVGLYDVYFKVITGSTVVAGLDKIMIIPAALTVTADSKSMYVGNTLPDFTYTVSGWQGSDSSFDEEPSVACSASGKKAGAYAIIPSGADAGSNYIMNYVNGTLTVYANSGDDSSSSSNSSTTAKNPDGSTTTTTTDKTTGAVTETTKTPSGTTGTVVTDRNGDVTEIKASVSSAAVQTAEESGEAVTLPVEVPAAKTTEEAPAVQVTVPRTAGSVKVEIPVEKVTPGTVAVIVSQDGTEKIVSTSVVTEGGVALTLDGSATVKVIDNSKKFTDVPAGSVFYNEVTALSAREIMVGKTEDVFDLYHDVTLNQVANVAGRITGAVDVSDFEAGVAWGKANGLETGSAAATRGDVLKALYVAAGSPAVEDTGAASQFKDADSIPADMVAIAAWAAQNGILKGTLDGNADLNAHVTRGQACALSSRAMGILV